MANIYDVEGIDQFLPEPKKSLGSFLDDYATTAQEVSSPYVGMAGKYGFGDDPAKIQGLGSDVRHTVGSALGKFGIQDYLSQFGLQPSNPISNFIGNVGIAGSTVAQEISDAIRGFRQAGLEGAINQPMEDVRANFRAMDIPYGTSIEDMVNMAVASSPSAYMANPPAEVQISRFNAPGPFNYGTAQAADTAANTGYNYGYSNPAVAVEDLGFIGDAPQIKEAIYQDRIMNPNLPGFAVQPSRFQNFKNQVSRLKDFLPFGTKSLTGMAARGIGSMLSNIAPRTYGYSQRTYDAMTPSQQEFVDDLYETGGLLEGYNKISAFGRGPLGTLSNRLGTIRNTLAKQKVKSKALQQREQQISNAINEAINRGERQALRDRTRSVDYGVTGGPTRTDIDVADGGAESGGRGKIVCTMMNESYGFGNFRNKIWLKHSKDLPKEYEVGYHTIFLPLVKFAKGKGKLNKIVKKTLEHIARHRTYDLKQEMKGKTHLLGRAYRKVLEPLCFITGKIKFALRRG